MNRNLYIEWLIINGNPNRREFIESWSDERLMNAYGYMLEADPSRTPIPHSTRSAKPRYRARVTVNNTEHYLGSFATKAQADEAVFRFKMGLTH